MDRITLPNQKLQVKLSGAFAILALLASTVVNITWFITSRQQLLENLSANLMNTAAVAALQVDADLHNRLTEPNKQVSQEYFAIQHALQQVKEAHSDISYIYTLRENSAGDILFMVDANPEPTPLGAVYADAGPVLRANFAAINEPLAENKIHTDQWGSWISGYAPFYDSEGKRAGVLALGMSAEKVSSYQQGMIGISLLVFAITIPVFAGLGWLLGQRLAAPVLIISQRAEQAASGDLDQSLDIQGEDEIGILARSLNHLIQQMKQARAAMDQHIQDRTQALARRSALLESASAVSREANSTLDPIEMAQKVVGLIRDQFNFYYVGLFLVDDAKEWAVLRAGTGQAGKKLLDQGHRLRIGEGMVGWCIEQGQARIAQNANKDNVRLEIAELAKTRSEAALPLRSRGQILGALTVQSSEPDAFDEAEIAVLQAMADQIGTALDNARLLAQTQEALNAARQAYGEISRQAWVELLRARPVPGYTCDENGLTPVATKNGSTRKPEDNNTPDDLPRIDLPILVRGQVLGTLEARKPGDQGEWTEGEINLMSTLVDQLGVALESARLYQESQRRAERERVAGEITAKVRASNDPQAILQTAVQELRQALQANRAQILLKAKPASSRPEEPVGEDALSGG